MTPDEKAEKSQKKWNSIGIFLQSLFFFANAVVWIVGLACLLGGLMLGFNSRTIILLDFHWLDLLATTPATLFITYGVFIMILTSVGCFASASGDRILLILFLVIALTIFVIDLVFGVWIFYSIHSLPNFVESLRKSLHGYSVEGAPWVGIIPLPAKIYWDHVQLRARCCGVYEFDEWLDTPFGKNWSLPDSCCNEDYEHKDCGKLLLRHPDTEHHSVINIINPMGLMKKFPLSLRKAFKETGIIGVSIGATVFFCFILAAFLLFIVIKKNYVGGGGPESRATGPGIHRDLEGRNAQGDGLENHRKQSWFANKRRNSVAPIPVPIDEPYRSSIRSHHSDRRDSVKSRYSDRRNSNINYHSQRRNSDIIHHNERRDSVKSHNERRASATSRQSQRRRSPARSQQSYNLLSVISKSEIMDGGYDVNGYSDKTKRIRTSL